MTDPDLDFRLVKPPPQLADYLTGYWMLRNRSDHDKDVIILPDGNIDLTLSRSADTPFHIVRSGLEAAPQPAVLSAKTVMFAISFRPLAVEYIFRDTIAGLLNYAEYLPDDFWGFCADDLRNFNVFCEKADRHITSLLPAVVDSRKAELFRLLHASDGAMPVKELSEKAFWSVRQINRYFNQRFGVPLKTYCGMLRFRSAFQQIKEGKLFPGDYFADQSHFIKEVRKLAGVSPKALQRNENGRFIQFSIG